jgi:hypothetical protein
MYTLLLLPQTPPLPLPLLPNLLPLPPAISSIRLHHHPSPPLKTYHHLSKMSPRPVPRLAMSATYRQQDHKQIASLFGLSTPIIMEGPLQRRNTTFLCSIDGFPNKVMLKRGEQYLKKHTLYQQLWYCNSRLVCEGSLFKKFHEMLDKFLKSKGLDGVCTSFTGADRLKAKTAIMDAFTSFAQSCLVLVFLTMMGQCHWQESTFYWQLRQLIVASVQIH